MPDATPTLPRKIIQAERPWWRLDLADAWAHRELLWLLMWRNVTSRYAQMALGMVWAILEPLALLLTLVLVFGFFVRVDTGNIPYPVFVFAAQIPWLLFAKATMNAVGCLQEHMALVSKVSFPRLLLPFASVFRDLFDSVILVLILIVVGMFYGYFPTWRLIVVPALLLSVTMLAIAIGLWLAGPAVRMRDVRPIMLIILQMGFYFSPILFPPSLVPPRFLPIYTMNPMYWAIEISRWAFLGRPVDLSPSFVMALVVVVIAFVSGLFVYAANERAAVDVQ
ncbi:MAG: ABC transporter permease [Acidobacteriota bacterium]|nr:ABC transporter permease [Acidobacteriota bacterium]